MQLLHGKGPIPTRRLLFIRPIVALGLTATLLGEPAPATTPSAATPSAANLHRLTESQIDELIEQLGARSYAAREAATQSLVKLGIVTQRKLSAALDHADAEISSRAAEILSAVVEADFQARLEAFAADVEGRHEHRLPGWEQFRLLMGNDETARSLFVEMQRAEPGLLAALETDAAIASQAVVVRCQEIAQAQESPDEFGTGAIGVGTAASLLFVAAAEGVAFDEQHGLTVCAAVQEPLQGLTRDGPRLALMRKLLGGWIARDSGSMLAVQNLWLSFLFDIPQGLELGERILARQTSSPEAKPYAILALGRFGDERHIAPLVPYLDDDSLWVRDEIGGVEVEVQTRDVALASLIALSQQSFRDYGLGQLESVRHAHLHPALIGFRGDSRRQLALRKWSEWQTARRSTNVTKAVP